MCGTDEAVFWTADMDVDCDGRQSPRCNSRTDPLFSDTTAYQQSDGRYLSAEALPYIVVPGASAIWNHREHGVRGGSVAAVVYRDRVQYAVVGDTGPHEIIGEASYAAAEALGIRTDPRGGGAPSGVTYIVFKDSQATPIESHASAVAVGERLARLFVRGAGVGEGTAAQLQERLEEPTGLGGSARQAGTGAVPGGEATPQGAGVQEELTAPESVEAQADSGDSESQVTQEDSGGPEVQESPDAGSDESAEAGQGDVGDEGSA